MYYINESFFGSSHYRSPQGLVIIDLFAFMSLMMQPPYLFNFGIALMNPAGGAQLIDADQIRLSAMVC